MNNFLISDIIKPYKKHIDSITADGSFYVSKNFVIDYIKDLSRIKSVTYNIIDTHEWEYLEDISVSCKNDQVICQECCAVYVYMFKDLTSFTFPCFALCPHLSRVTCENNTDQILYKVYRCVHCGNHSLALIEEDDYKIHYRNALLEAPHLTCSELVMKEIL